MKFQLKLSLITLLAFALCTPMMSSAQDYAFKVLVNKGRNEIKAGSVWQQIKVGISLKSGDELRIAENAYLGLVHVSGKPLEMKHAGDYKVVDLAAKVSGGSSVLNRYTDFILSENSKKKNNLVATGAVHRGLGIDVYLPDAANALVYANVVAINWNSEKISGPYTVRFKSIFGEELEVMETKENMVRVDLYNDKFKNEDNILIEVTPANSSGSTPDAYMIKKLSSADRQRILEEMKLIEAPLLEKTALNQLVLAGFYEQNRLLIDAATAYLEAIALAPDVTAYKDAYNEFLLRYGLKENN